MKTRFSQGLALTLLAVWSAPAVAQVPGPVVAPAPVPAAAAPAAQFNFFEMFNCTQLKKDCKECLCATPLGQMVNNMTGMAGTFTGGLIPPLCPPKTAEDLAKLLADPNKSSAEKLAEEIKAQEAQAKARAAAMRFLGTVDCERFKEAGFNVPGELIKGLNDTSECVRLAAAEALSNGCCCNEDTIEALAAVAAGAALFKKDEKTGLRTPAAGVQIMPEKCPRVRAAARFALERCLCCFVRKEPYQKKPGIERREGDPLPRREGVPAVSAGGNVQQVRFDETQQPQRKETLGMPSEKVLKQAEQVLQGCGTIDTPAVPARDGSLFGLCKRAYHKNYKPQIIRTTILDTTKDCQGKDVPVGADANAVIRPKSQLKDNMRTMFSPIERGEGRQGGASDGMPTGATPQSAPGSSGQQPSGGSTQPSSTGVQPIIIYEAPPKQVVVSQANVPMIVQPVKQPVYVPAPVTPAPRPVMMPTASKKSSSFSLPFFSKKPAPQQTAPVMVETISQPLPVQERRVVPVTIEPVTQPMPLPPQERRIVSYKLQPPQ